MKGSCAPQHPEDKAQPLAFPQVVCFERWLQRHHAGLSPALAVPQQTARQ